MRKMSFGEALIALKKGKRVARSGWNGKGMYLVYFSPVSHGLEMLTVYDKEDGTTLPLLPFILMKTADDMYVPWLSSQTDCLAEDYEIVETESQEGGYYVWGNKTFTHKHEENANMFSFTSKLWQEAIDSAAEKAKESAFEKSWKEKDREPQSYSESDHKCKDCEKSPLKICKKCYLKYASENLFGAKPTKTLSEALNIKKIADDFAKSEDFDKDDDLEKIVDDSLADIAAIFKIPLNMMIGSKYYSTEKKEETDAKIEESQTNVDESVPDFKAMELKIIEQITELSAQLKDIQDEKERAKGSLFDIVYAPDASIAPSVNHEKSQKFWEFVRTAKANGYKRIVLTNGEQYKIEDDVSITRIL